MEPCVWCGWSSTKFSFLLLFGFGGHGIIFLTLHVILVLLVGSLYSKCFSTRKLHWSVSFISLHLFLILLVENLWLAEFGTLRISDLLYPSGSGTVTVTVHLGEPTNYWPIWGVSLCFGGFWGYIDSKGGRTDAL